MGNPKRQHFVPQSVLRFFEGEDGQVFFFDKQSPNSDIEKRNRRSVFWQKHAYTLTHEDGTKNYSIEHEFGKEFDDKIGKLIQRRLTLSYSGLHCSLCKEDRTLLLAFALNLFVRNPKTQAHVRGTAAFGAAHTVITLANSLCRRSALTVEAQTKELMLQSRNTNELASEFFDGFGVHFCMPSDENRSFVIGSLPICRFEPTEEEWITNPFGKSERQFEFFLPLAPRLAFLLSGKNNSDCPISVPTDLVDKVNLKLFSQSDSVVSQSCTEIRTCVALNSSEERECSFS
ncbi:DUF4238 domain-containing protein [Marivita sp. S2033]|uniref:DUF4238 domain-containing protein n=1 Tax=Marivita sp. S2033 TaxID=3373187 RepID=UPI003981E888